MVESSKVACAVSVPYGTCNSRCHSEFNKSKIKVIRPHKPLHKDSKVKFTRAPSVCPVWACNSITKFFRKFNFDVQFPYGTDNLSYHVKVKMSKVKVIRIHRTQALNVPQWWMDLHTRWNVRGWIYEYTQSHLLNTEKTVATTGRGKGKRRFV